MKKKTVFCLTLLLPAAAVILNVLPGSVRMNWMGGYTTFCSGFSLIPMGYGNWGPMLSGVGAAVLCLLAVIREKYRKKALSRAMCVIAIVCAAVRLLTAVFFGFTVIGVAVTLCLLAQCAIVHCTM